MTSIFLTCEQYTGPRVALLWQHGVKPYSPPLPFLPSLPPSRRRQRCRRRSRRVPVTAAAGLSPFSASLALVLLWRPEGRIPDPSPSSLPLPLGLVLLRAAVTVAVDGLRRLRTLLVPWARACDGGSMRERQIWPALGRWRALVAPMGATRRASRVRLMPGGRCLASGGEAASAASKWTGQIWPRPGCHGCMGRLWGGLR